MASKRRRAEDRAGRLLPGPAIAASKLTRDRASELRLSARRVKGDFSPFTRRSSPVERKTFLF